MPVQVQFAFSIPFSLPFQKILYQGVVLISAVLMNQMRRLSCRVWRTLTMTSRYHHHEESRRARALELRLTAWPAMADHGLWVSEGGAGGEVKPDH